MTGFRIPARLAAFSAERADWTAALPATVATLAARRSEKPFALVCCPHVADLTAGFTMPGYTRRSATASASALLDNTTVRGAASPASSA